MIGSVYKYAFMFFVHRLGKYMNIMFLFVRGLIVRIDGRHSGCVRFKSKAEEVVWRTEG